MDDKNKDPGSEEKEIVKILSEMGYEPDGLILTDAGNIIDRNAPRKYTIDIDEAPESHN